VLIEQALFTMRPGKPWDERPAAQTSGIDDDQVAAIDAALQGLKGAVEPASGAVAISFFPLPANAYCVARTVPAAGGGFALGTVLTHCLVVNQAVMTRFANNPFALLHAAMMQGWLRPSEPGWPRLHRFAMEGSCAPLDASLLSSLAVKPGLAWFETLVETALAHPAVALPLGLPQPRLFAALFSCLPIECRPWFSFTTGPARAAQSAFRLFCLDRPTFQSSAADGAQTFQLLDLFDEPRARTTAGGWAGLVSQAIRQGRLDWLSEQLRIARPGLRPETLNGLGNELLQLLATLPHGEKATPAAAEFDPPDCEPPSHAPLRRPDGAHQTGPTALQASGTAAATVSSQPLDEDPSQVLSRQNPAALRRLEQLDDVVFEAIAGKSTALDQMRALWPAVVAELGRDLIEESQGQYLRHAMRVWKECLSGEELRNPRLAVAAAEVIGILLGVD
jgi:GTPase-associated protein 1, N-terminal domain type 2